MRVPRRWTLPALALVMAAGYLLRFHLPAPEMLRDAAGGATYVVAAALGLLVVAPHLTALQASALGFAFTCAVEFSHLVSTPWLEAIRATWIGRLALGNAFGWSDFGPYAAGGLIAWGLAGCLPRVDG